MSTQLLISADREGCWLDGKSGWRNSGRVIILAIDYGFKPPEGIGPTIRLVNQYMSGADMPGQISLYEAIDSLAEAATDYMSSVAPDGYYFEWEAYELTLRKDEPDEG